MKKKPHKKERGGDPPPAPAIAPFAESDAMEIVNRLAILRDELNRLLQILTEAGFTIELNTHSPLQLEEGELRYPFPQLDLRVYHVLVDTTKTGAQPVLPNPLGDNWDDDTNEDQEE